MLTETVAPSECGIRDIARPFSRTWMLDEEASRITSSGAARDSGAGVHQSADAFGADALQGGPQVLGLLRRKAGPECDAENHCGAQDHQRSIPTQPAPSGSGAMACQKEQSLRPPPGRRGCFPSFLRARRFQFKPFGNSRQFIPRRSSSRSWHARIPQSLQLHAGIRRNGRRAARCASVPSVPDRRRQTARFVLPKDALITASFVEPRAGCVPYSASF